MENENVSADKTFRIERFVNIDELVFDVVLTLFVLVIRGVLIPAGKTVVDILNPVTAVFLTCLIDYFVAFFLGILYLRFSPAFEKHGWVKGILYTVIALTMLFLYIGIPVSMYRFGLITSGAIIIPFLVGLFLMVGGAFFGFNKDKKAGCAVSIVILLIPGFIGMIMLMTLIGRETKSWFLEIAGFVIGMFLAFYMVIGMFRLQLFVVEGESRASGIARTAVFGVLFPVMIALLLGFWQEITIVGLVKDGGTFGFQMIFSLVLYGIIPLRILMALAPPYRVINTGIGLASLALYILTLRSYIESLIGKV